MFLISTFDRIIPVSIALKSGRLFSNPFGILGHDPCATNLDGRNVTGICYNEVECLLK